MARDATTVEPGVELVPLDMGAAELAAVFSGASDWQPAPVDAAQVSRQIMEQILGATSEEDLWKELPTWGTKGSVGVSFQVDDVRIYQSRFTIKDEAGKDTGRKGAFVSCPAVNLDTGELGVLNTSAARPAGKLIALARMGALPCKVRVVERGESSGGFTVLDLERV